MTYQQGDIVKVRFGTGFNMHREDEFFMGHIESIDRYNSVFPYEVVASSDLVMLTAWCGHDALEIVHRPKKPDIQKLARKLISLADKTDDIPPAS